MGQTSQTPAIRALAQLLEPWDLRSSHRSRMHRAWRQVIAQLGDHARRCILCGEAPVSRCHVRPQEEGFPPEDNLVPLCERGAISPVIDLALKAWWSDEPDQRAATAWQAWNRKTFVQVAAEHGPRIGCHKLLDDGFISVETIASSGAEELHPEVRASALGVPMTKLDSNFGAATTRRLRLRQLKAYASSLPEGSDEWCKAYCEYISTGRRLSSPRTMAITLKAVSMVKLLVDSPSICRQARSRFYYEEALTWMQRHPDPDIARAIDCLKQSIEAAGEGTTSAAMSELELIHAEMLAAPAAKRVSTWQRRQETALAVLSTEPDKRWTVNQRLHRAQLHIKTWHKPRAVLEELKSIRDARHQLTLANGWTRFQAVHLAAAEGMAHAQDGNYEAALIALSRATIVMRGGCRGKRPEGYKDIARCAGWVLRQMKGERDRARRILALAREMVDGRSGAWADQ